jgi:hypothetical protein
MGTEQASGAYSVEMMFGGPRLVAIKIIAFWNVVCGELTFFCSLQEGYRTLFPNVFV